MLREILRSKIYYAKISQTKLYYQGSITLDANMIKAADLIAGEKVDVLNLDNGSRFQTYVIRGNKKGLVALNGPAARQGEVGQKIAILSYGFLDGEEMKKHKAKYVVLDDKNKIKRVFSR